MTKFVTFYSYKGGVGRSLALVNVAHSLAMKGRRVFVLDFDLEAPGLDTMLEFHNPGPNGKGLVEYISEYKQKGIPPKNLKEYTRAVSLGEASGGMWLMPAGKKDSAYQIELCKLDWKDFYRKKDGFFFIENLKSQIKKEFTPDYVLIDSRTGLTDIGGVCTLHLPDMVVLLFGLNKQNLEGIEQVRNTIQYNPLGKEIELLYVASPVPDGISLVEQRLKEVKDRLKIENESFEVVHYNSGLALEERVLVAGDIYLPQKIQYEKIASWIIKRNNGDFESILDRCRKYRSDGMIEEAAVGFLSVARSFPSNEYVCVEAAKGLASIGKYAEALECINSIVKLSPKNTSYILETARIYEKWGKKEHALKKLSELSPTMFQKESGVDVLEVARIYERLKKNTAAKEWMGYAMECYSATQNCWLAWQIAEFAMGTKDYAIAKDLYLKGCERGEVTLPAAYNIGYAMYKLGDKGCEHKFRIAVTLFEKMGPEDPLSDANRFQAMHYAYKYLGDFAKAMACLNKVRTLLAPFKGYGDHFSLLSPTKYRLVKLSDFLKENKKEMLVLEALLKSKRKKSVKGQKEE